MKHCPECGWELIENQKFCDNCGMSLIEFKEKKAIKSEQIEFDKQKSQIPSEQSSMGTETNPGRSTQVAKEKSSKGGLFFAVIGILLFLFVINSFGKGCNQTYNSGSSFTPEQKNDLYWQQRVQEDQQAHPSLDESQKQTIKQMYDNALTNLYGTYDHPKY